MKFNNLIPELTVSDIGKSIDFYKKLGFKVEYKRKDDKFAFLSMQGSQIMIQGIEENNWKTGELKYPFGRGINLEIGVNNINSLYALALKNKVKIFKEIKNNCYKVKGKSLNSREFLILDPDGYLLRFSGEFEY